MQYQWRFLYESEEQQRQPRKPEESQQRCTQGWARQSSKPEKSEPRADQGRQEVTFG